MRAAVALWSVRIVLLLRRELHVGMRQTHERCQGRVWRRCSGTHLRVRSGGSGAVARAQRANVVPWIGCNGAARRCRDYATLVGGELRNTWCAGAATYFARTPAATCSAARNTRSALSPATFFTSCSLHPRRKSSAMRSGNFDTSSSPTGNDVIPSKSEPSPTASTPATSRMCSMWFATCTRVAFGARASHARVESATTAVSTPAARSARARVAMLSSNTRTASETKPGLKFTITMPPFARTSLRIESGTSRAWPVSARAEECENMTGARVVCRASDMVASLTCDRSTRIPSRFISCTTSRPNAESPRRAVSVEAGPRETPPVGERDVADAERREHPQRAERVLDCLPTLDADQTRDLPRLEVPLDVGRRARQGEVARILGTQPLDQVDLLERVHRRVRPGIERGDGNIGRPELRPNPARAEFRDVGHELGLQHREVDGIERTALAHRVRDVVVAIDEGHRLEDPQSLGTVVLGD